MLTKSYRHKKVPPPPKKNTKTFITSPFFDEITWVFFYLVCFTAVNLCAKNVLSINHSSGDKFKVLASPGTFNTLFLGYVGLDKFHHNSWPKTDN